MQSDLKKSERDLHQQLAMITARQKQEISTLREQELLKLRGELEWALYKVRELHERQEEYKPMLNRFEKLHEVEKAATSQRLDSLDVVIGKILLRLEALEKRLKDKP